MFSIVIIVLLCVLLVFLVLFFSAKRLSSYEGKAGTLIDYIVDHKKTGDPYFENAVKSALQRYSKTYKWPPAAFNVAYKSLRTEHSEALTSGQIDLIVYNILTTELVMQRGPQGLSNMGEGVKAELIKIREAVDKAYDKIYIRKTLGLNPKQ